VTSPKVAILPYGRGLGVRPARLPLASLDWPLGAPAGIEGAALGDLGRDDHLIVPPRDTLHLRPGFGTRAQVSLLFREPRAIHGHHMRLLQLFSHRRFFRVLTGDPALRAAIPNGLHADRQFGAVGRTDEKRDTGSWFRRECFIVDLTRKHDGSPFGHAHRSRRHSHEARVVGCEHPAEYVFLDALPGGGFPVQVVRYEAPSPGFGRQQRSRPGFPHTTNDQEGLIQVDAANRCACQDRCTREDTPPGFVRLYREKSLPEGFVQSLLSMIENGVGRCAGVRSE